MSHKNFSEPILTLQIDAAPVAKPGPPAKVLNIVRSSKVRHVEGQTLHKSTFIDRVPTISTTVPGDSNAFAVSVYHNRPVAV